MMPSSTAGGAVPLQAHGDELLHVLLEIRFHPLDPGEFERLFHERVVPAEGPHAYRLEVHRVVQRLGSVPVYAQVRLEHARHLKSALIVAAWDSNDWTMKDVSAHYGTVSRCLGMEDIGQILATGCGTPGMTARSPFMERAYRLGRSLE